jgi:hypothetical protein
MVERKDVRIMSVPAVGGVRTPSPHLRPEDIPVEAIPKRRTLMDVLKESVLFDPDRPHMGPNELAKELERNPSGLLINCHSCKKDMSAPVYLAHLWDTKEGIGCIRRWFNTMDVQHRRFSGASIGDNDE